MGPPHLGPHRWLQLARLTHELATRLGSYASMFLPPILTFPRQQKRLAWFSQCILPLKAYMLCHTITSITQHSIKTPPRASMRGFTNRRTEVPIRLQIQAWAGSRRPIKTYPRHINELTGYLIRSWSRLNTKPRKHQWIKSLDSKWGNGEAASVRSVELCCCVSGWPAVCCGSH